MQKKTARVMFFFVFLVQACASPTLEPKTSIPSPTLTSIPTSTETPKPALTATVTVEPTSTIEVLSALEGIDTIQFDIDGDGVVDYTGIVKAENSINPSSIEDAQVTRLTDIRVINPGDDPINTSDYSSVSLPGSYYTGYREIEIDKDGQKATVVFYTMSLLRPDKTWVSAEMNALKASFDRLGFDLDANLGERFVDLLDIPVGDRFSNATIEQIASFLQLSPLEVEMSYGSSHEWLQPDQIQRMLAEAPAGSTVDLTEVVLGSAPQK